MTEKAGSLWSTAGTFNTYELAADKVTKIQENNNLQTKIRRRANGMFLVKYRKDPALAKEEEVKNVKKSGKSRKSNTAKREPKFDASSV